MDVRAGDTAMQDIADDGNRQVREVLFVVADRIHVEQPLRRMGMTAVTGVDDMDMIQFMLVQMGCDQKRGTGLVMADDEHVGTHRCQVVDSIQQGFPLAGGRGRNVQVDHVSRQAFGCDFESRPGTGRILEKEVENAFAAH